MAKAKKIEGLDCEGGASDAMRLVLGVRLEEMCGFGAAALEWESAKGVHDMRVASRRLRSALRDFKPYLRRRQLSSVGAELKRVADALGAVRDQDVALAALEALRAEAPEEVTRGIAQLAGERRLEREAARESLRKAITEEKLFKLQTDFNSALERAAEPRRRVRKKKAAAYALSFRQAGREVTGARLEELRNLSACLYQPFEVDALHRMRIAAKRLRYAMQLFAACCGEELARHAAEVAELQTSLGELHDCDAWLKALGRMLQGFQEREDESRLTTMERQKQSAAVWLMGHFARTRMKHFNQAL